MKANLCIFIAFCSASLAQTTVQEWQAEAALRYPDLKDPSSSLNQKFVAEVKTRRVTSPEFFSIPMWPVTLAAELVASNEKVAAAQKEFEEAVAKSELKAIDLYPSSGTEGSPLHKAITAELAKLDQINSPIMQDPDYPVMLAAKCAAKLGISPLQKGAGKPTPPPVELVTVEDVKRYWLENQPKLPGTLDPGFHAIRDQNAMREMAIQNGDYDAEAKDQANAINIERLTEVGRTSDANALRNERADYRVELARKAAEEAQQRQADATAIYRQQLLRQLQAQNFQLGLINQHIQNQRRIP